MLTLSQGTLEAQAKRRKVSRWAVSHRLRYWDVNAQAFTFIGAFTEIPRSDVAMLGITRDALDRGDINEFKSSNVTIELRNRRNEWSLQNPGGKFKADLTARLGYEQQLMEFKLEVFYELDDGSESAAITLFIGHASTWDFYPARGVVSVTLESKHVLLRRSNAENVSNPFVNQLLIATGDPLVFVTSQGSIGRVSAVRISGAPQRLGADVQVSDLNVHNLPAKFTFLVPPSATPRADYIQWKRDQKIDQLVKDVAVAAGIPLTQQLVEPVVYTNRVINTKIYTTQADWDGGLTRTNIDPSTVAGQFNRRWNLVDDFSDLDFTANPVWTIDRNDSSRTTFSAATGALVLSQTGSAFGGIYATLSKAYGSWRWNATSNGSAPGSSSVSRFYFIRNEAGEGYNLQISNGGTVRVRLVRVAASQIETEILDVAAADTAAHEWRITRSSSGEFKVYRDGTLMGTVTDNTFTTGTRFRVASSTGSDVPTDSLTLTFDDLYWSEGIDTGATTVTNATSLWESQFIDGTVDLGDWLSIVLSKTEPIGTSTLVETATADESFPGSGVPGVFDAYVAVGPAGQVQSIKRRFLKLRITLTSTAFPEFESPDILDATLTYITSTTTIRMANFLGMTGFDAIQKLGEIANYEWGFTRDGKLFFRPRSSATVIQYTIRLKNLQAPHITRISDGIDRVFNEVRGTYGTHERLVNPTTQNDSRPTSVDRFGVHRLNIGGSQILVNPDADIATGLTISYYDRFRSPRRRFELIIDMAPQLELGDVILIQVADALPNPPWHIGDTSRWVGNTGIHLFGHEQQSAFDIKSRVLSVGHDPNIGANLTRLELEEVL